MKNKNFSVVTKFMEWVAKVGKQGVIYRGLADSDWDVAASIHGRLKENGIETVHYNIFREMTKRLLARARAEGHDIENHRQLPDLELLAKLQHHGAATCLIDFTRNPLIALWFACQAPIEKSGKIVAFDSGNTDLCREIQAKDLDKPIDKWLPVNTPDKRLWVLPPKKMDNRIVAQQSIFVLGEGVIAQEKLTGKENFLVEDKSAVLQELAHHGITAESLFCDFAGFARQNARDVKYHNWATDNDFISGLACHESGNYESAIAFYDNVIKADSQHAPAYNNRGVSKAESGDLPGATADYDRAIEINSEYATAYNNRGNVKKRSSDLSGAIADYDRAIEINPQYAVAYINRGDTKGQLNDMPGAIADYDRAIEINPQDAVAYYNRGLAKYSLGDHEGTIADFDRVIEIRPQDAGGHNNRGYAKKKWRDRDGTKAAYKYSSAIADFDRAIELDPQLALAYHNRGNTKKLQGDKDGTAEADFRKTKKIDPSFKHPEGE